VQTLGIDTGLAAFKFDGYMAYVYSIDGQALTPNSFGTFNSYGVWQPITYGGSYGTNGFYLPFNRNTTSSYAGVFSGSNYITSNYSFNWASGGSFTMEAWICPSAFSSVVNMIGGTTTSANDGYSFLYYYTNGSLAFGINGTNEFVSATGLVNAGNWYHVALVNNSGALTIYLNGQAVAFTSSGSTYLSNNSASMRMGGNTTGATQGVIGNMSNFRFVTSAVYTSNFTPPTTDLTAITNTQLLTFQNSTIVDNSGNSRSLTNTGSVTTSVQYPNNLTFFNDQGPAGNNWTPKNLSLSLGSTYDSMTDAPTLTSATAANYPVINPLDKGTNATVDNGNLRVYSSSGWTVNRATMSYPTTGKYYFEWIYTDNTPAASVGIATSQAASTSSGLGTDAYGWGYQYNGNKYNNNVGTAYGATYTTGDVIGVAFDASAGTLTYYKNNTSQGVAFTGLTTATYFPVSAVASATAAQAPTINFGQQPFTYTPPSGFVALNTYNI
jgi:hypothetical protein